MTSEWIKPSHGAPVKEEAATYMQQGWLAALDSAVCRDSVVFGWDLRGVLDLDVLRETVGRLIVRHESLRTNYVRDEAGVRQVVWPAEMPDLPLVDLSALPVVEAEVELERAMLEEAERPVSLTESALWRGFVVRMAAEHHVLVTAAHHSIIDAASQRVMHDDLCRIYQDVWRGCAGTVPGLLAQLGDYARSEREPLSANVETFWREQLGVPERLNLPYARTWRLGRFVSMGAEWPSITAAEVDELEKIATSAGASLGTALRAVLAAVLSPFADDAVVIGVVCENRKPAERKGLIGDVTMQLPVRVVVDGDPSFVDLVEAAHHAWVDARRFSAPLRAIRRAVGAGEDGGRLLCDVAVNWYPEPAVLPVAELLSADGGVLTMARRPQIVSRVAEFDREFHAAVPLSVTLVRSAGGGVSGELWTERTAFTSATIKTFGRMFGGVVAAVVSGSTAGVRSLARRVSAG